MRSLLLAVVAGGLVSFPTAIALTREKCAASATDAIANSVASLIRMPFQNTTNTGVVLPIITQFDIKDDNTQQSGLSDVVISVLFPMAVPRDGVMWVQVLHSSFPTSTNDL
jgi:hypothetical protein